MKLTEEIIDCESKMSPNEKKILREVLTTIEKLNDHLEDCGIYEKTMYIDFNEHSLSYIIINTRVDWPINVLTYDPERLMEDVNVLKNYIWL